MTNSAEAAPEPSAALVRDWTVCALVAASARFVPLPVVDDALADQAVRETVRRTLRDAGRDYPVELVGALYSGGGWVSDLTRAISRIPMKLLLFPVRKITRVVGAARGVPEDLTRVLLLGVATHRVLARGGLAGDDRAALRAEAESVRRAYDDALAGTDVRLVGGVLADTLSGVSGLPKAVIEYARNRFADDRTSGPLEPPGPVAEGVSRVQAALRRPDVQRRLAEFDARFDERLAQ